MDLFTHAREAFLQKNAPLADRMRPRTLDEFVGQDHIIGPGRLLRRAIQIDQLSSLIFYGPPGTGKTTLARIIANTTKAGFLAINAVLAGVKELREAIGEAQQNLSLHGRRTILFIDEVHRFNKSQQDALLPHVEHGIIILIGATTENPYFEVNKALVSRSRIFELLSLGSSDLYRIAEAVLTDTERGYGNRGVDIAREALDHLVSTANGDARGVLNALELAVETTPPDKNGRITITLPVAEESIQKKAVLYDKDGDIHYDTVSAFIKSIRGSDPDAALYWMARMITAGEDPRFIFRRMLILASEDIGLADPHALGVVVNAARAFDYVGMPEGRFHLSQACLYLAAASKSNSTMGFFDALEAVSRERTDDIPIHLKDGSRDAEGLGHGKGYLYPHAYRDHWVAQQYLPQGLQGKIFFHPSQQGKEKEMGARLAQFRESRNTALLEQEDRYPGEGSGEVYTEKEQWIQRTTSDGGMSFLRDVVLRGARIIPENIVLDCNARSGLLTFAALRRAARGTVWACVHDTESMDNLTALANHYPALHRPQLVQTSWKKLRGDLCAAAGDDIRFDAVVGTHILGNCRDWPFFFHMILGLLKPGGVCSIGEFVPSEGCRLSELVTFPKDSEMCAQVLSTIEEELFHDVESPKTSWNSATVHSILSDLPGISCRVVTEEHRPLRWISHRQVDRWFRNDTSRPLSLGDRLRERLTDKQFKTVQRVVTTSLANKEVRWRQVVLHITAQAEALPGRRL